MRKQLLLSGAALMLSLNLATAQGLTTTSAYDDFATATEYTDIAWSVDAGSTSQLAITRAAGGMSVAGTSGSGQYPFIKVDFGSNLNLQTNSMADVEITVQNTSSTQSLLLDVRLIDENDVQSDIEPNISDVTSSTTYGDNTGAPYYYTHRKAFNAFTVAPNATKVARIDLSSVSANLGGLTWTGCVNGSPYTCPTAAHNIDPAAIKGVIFRVNFGSGGIDISEADGNPVHDSLIASVSRYTGTFKVTSFKIGSVLSGTNDASAIDGSLKVYPNPAKESLTVSFESVNTADVSLTDIVGNKIYSTTANAGSNQINVNTSGLTTGMYILNVSTDNGRVARKITIK